MSGDAPDTDRFLDLVAAAEAKDPRLNRLQAGLVVAADLGIARDSRSFARIFGIAHALALRELNALFARGGMLRIVKRDERTMRLFYEPISGGADEQSPHLD